MKIENYVLGAALALFAGCHTVVPQTSNLIADKGEAKEHAANTIPAYRLAADRGFGFRAEIGLTKSGKILTYAQDVDQRARLEDVLELVRGNRRTILEIKGGAAIVPVLKAALSDNASATPDRLYIASPNPDVCKALRDVMSEYPVLWRTESENPDEILGVLADTGAAGVDLKFGENGEKLIAAVRQAGYAVNAWNVSDYETAVCALSAGADTVSVDGAQAIFDTYREQRRGSGGFGESYSAPRDPAALMF